MRLFSTILILNVALEIEGFGLNFWKLRLNVQEKELLSYNTQHTSYRSPDPPHLFGTQEIVQPLDHFDPQIKTTFIQRYWVNSDYWHAPNGPVFIYIGGEGGLSELAAVDGAYIKFAQNYGALIFAVEHRFYGQSINDDGLKLENLQHLSSQQALADLSNFHLRMSKLYNLTQENKWISFGGSYAGSLSAWFRIKYPHLVHGAVASSPPVRALVNFEGYNDVVAKSLATEIVGGSQKCADMVRAAFKTVDDLILKRNLTKLSHDFLSCDPVESELDVVQFVSNLADTFMGVVQYNNEGRSGLNIKDVCGLMTQGPDSYQNFVTYNKKFLEETKQNCSDNSWQKFLKQLSNETVDRTQSGVGMRQWIYQTCSQFGYYQTCDDDDCIFSRHMTLSPNFEICAKVFNLSSQEVYDQVDFTNAYYGSDKPQGSRILFVNGLIDPWHALSVLDDVTKSELAVVIPGTAHCADMRDDRPEDPSALRDAREKINSQIGKWLSEEKSGVDSTRKPHFTGKKLRKEIVFKQEDAVL